MDEDQLGPVEDGGASAKETPEAERQGQADAPAAQALDDGPRTQSVDVGAPATTMEAQPSALAADATDSPNHEAASEDAASAVAETPPDQEQAPGTDVEAPPVDAAAQFETEQATEDAAETPPEAAQSMPGLSVTPEEAPRSPAAPDARESGSRARERDAPERELTMAELLAQSEGQSATDMGSLLEQAERQQRSARRGDVVEGVVVRVDHDEALVDIGGKSEAVIPAREMPHTRGEGPQFPEVGEQILAVVVQQSDEEGRMVLSLSKAQAERNWRDLQVHFENGDVLEGHVVEHNKGGLIVSVAGVRGFLPLSQIAELRRGSPEENVEERLAAMKGRQVVVKII